MMLKFRGNSAVMVCTHAIALLTAAAAAVWLAQPTIAWQTKTADAAPVGPLDAGRTLDEVTVESVNQAFRLMQSEIVQLDVDTTPGRPIQAAVIIAGEACTLSLMPSTVRSPGYKLVAQVEDGSYVEVDPGPDRSVRGSIIEMPGSKIAGAATDTGLHLLIRFPDDRQFWIEPLMGRVAGAQPGQHVLYSSENIIHPDGSCGVDNDFLLKYPAGNVGGSDGGGSDGAAVQCAEVGVDADFQYYTAYGSDLTNVQDRISLVVNTMNLQYVNQVNIQHFITQLIVRTSSNQPYTATDASSLLGQFQSQWNNNHGNVPRDVAHLFTGRNIDGSTIGIAYLGVICNTGSAYGLVQSDCCGSLGCATDLSAHELGHNWSAGHCSSSCSSTMNPSITCVNTFANSTPNSITQISGFRDGILCLAACADATLPFSDQFPGTAFDPGKWGTISGATIVTALSPPSAPLAMRLRGNATTGGNEARTSRINTSNMGILNLQYHYQRGGNGSLPITGRDLIVEYFNNVGTWVEISRQLGGGTAMNTFAQATASFPEDAKHTEFRLRFRVSSSQNAHDWFVDNVLIDGVAAPSNNHCSSAAIRPAGTYAFSTFAASTSGPSEPNLCTSNGDSQIHNDVWYIFPAQCTGTAKISLCGTGFDAKMAVYQNACPTSSNLAIACSDNVCGTSPEVTFPVTYGSLYRFRIGSAVPNVTGSGTMVITCEPTPPPSCTGDTNEDAQVNVADLLAVISAWGNCTGCAADINDDGAVNVADLLSVISNWGACP